MTTINKRLYENLKEIISKTDKKPTIVNHKSNFVVITYWWGRGNKNMNTSRPCSSFFEVFIKTLINTTVKGSFFNNLKVIIKNAQKKNNKDIVYHFIDNSEEVKRIALKFSRDYFVELLNKYDLYETYKKTLFSKEKQFEDLKKNYDEIYSVLNEKINQNNKGNYEIKKFEDVYEFFRLLLADTIFLLFKELNELIQNKEKYNKYKNDINLIFNKTNDKTISKDEKVEIKRRVHEYKTNEDELLATIKTKIRTNTDSFREGSFKGRSLLEILNNELRFIEPLLYEEMITKWEESCRKNGCNYMAVEYPEFAKKGGYQMAINAKPLFIQKALEITNEDGINGNGNGNSRGVLYIDGDMFIRKYPKIFDLDNIDFMARGWWIDPRSSYNSDSSIMIDPYTFETSGGTMFFANNIASRRLADLWINESGKEYQQGKADDRILSLVFNTYRLLLPMKILQLPIEYLWLTLDYDSRLMDDPGYGKTQIDDMIFIEHPECLTSEDTATDKGASSDRTPKYYYFEDLVPISEIYRERLLYPDESYKSCLDSYLQYLKTLKYIDDGNELLYSKKLVVKGNDTEENENPFYVVNYEDNMGNYKYFNDNTITYNDVFNTNIKGSADKNLSNEIETKYKIIKEDNTIIIRCNPQKTQPEKDIKLIQYVIKCLLTGKKVLYYPITEKADNYYQLLTETKKHLYENMDFVFKYKEHRIDAYFSDYYKVQIDFNAPFTLNNSNPITIFLLAIHLHFEDLSETFDNGMYQFISLMRIAFITGKTCKKLHKNDLCVISGGGDKSVDKIETDYEYGLEYLFGCDDTNTNNDKQTKKNSLISKKLWSRGSKKGSTIKSKYIFNSNSKKNTRKTPTKRKTI